MLLVKRIYKFIKIIKNLRQYYYIHLRICYARFLLFRLLFFETHSLLLPNEKYHLALILPASGIVSQSVGTIGDQIITSFDTNLLVFCQLEISLLIGIELFCTNYCHDFTFLIRRKNTSFSNNKYIF